MTSYKTSCNECCVSHKNSSGSRELSCCLFFLAGSNGLVCARVCRKQNSSGRANRLQKQKANARAFSTSINMKKLAHSDYKIGVQRWNIQELLLLFATVLTFTSKADLAEVVAAVGEFPRYSVNVKDEERSF